MDVKLFDSELKIMDILWNEGNKTAKELAKILNEQVGWSKTTTYTVIKKCLGKGIITRSEPNFVCSAAVAKEQVQEAETAELINKMYDGSADQLIASLLDRKQLSSQEIERLRELVKEMK